MERLITKILFLNLLYLLIFVCAVSALENQARSENTRKLRIMVFGAHPDDCELKAGGVAALWVAQGHAVKFVSATNGDIGHAEMSGGELAKRRTAEVEKAAKVLGIETEVLDIHDGEIMPTLENRKKFVKLIREWNADIVMGHRPNDYHPDHRYTGILMQDAAFMVMVKFFCPDVPQLAKNPVFLFLSDNFQKPYPFEPDIVVGTDGVFDKKINAIWNLESQIESLWATGNFEKIVPVPTEPEKRKERFNSLRERIANRDKVVADKFRKNLIEIYGEQKGKSFQFAEAFEVCEYGRQPTTEELKQLFPIH